MSDGKISGRIIRVCLGTFAGKLHRFGPCPCHRNSPAVGQFVTEFRMRICYRHALTIIFHGRDPVGFRRAVIQITKIRLHYRDDTPPCIVSKSHDIREVIEFRNPNMRHTLRQYPERGFNFNRSCERYATTTQGTGHKEENDDFFIRMNFSVGISIRRNRTGWNTEYKDKQVRPKHQTSTRRNIRTTHAQNNRLGRNMPRRFIVN